MNTRARLVMSAACVAWALSGCASTPPDEDPVQIKLKDLDTRLARIERVMANQSLLEVSNQLEALRSDVRAMHNDVDQLSNALESGRKQQRDMYADLDQRLKNLETRGGAAAASSAAPAAGAAAPVAPAAAAAGASSDSGEDKTSYQTAFNLLKDGQYDRAIAAFQKFLVSYPDSSLADNAQYWLGEAYYVNKSYPEAEAAFQRVIDKYPQSRKLADALLKIGFCRYELKQWQSAREVLGQVVARFTDTPAARLAQQRLDKMSAEKH
ncbi:MAG TPA: tol-pal system protein YbgF [Steroidobacteraceae bacterium]|nr:tol-pal system protein YbgF [Steroidobacteraceae bacterium]